MVPPPRRPWIAARAVLFVALVLSSKAQANAGVHWVAMPDNEGGAFVERRTVLAVEHEDLEFRCDKDHCDFKAAYAVLNPSDAREEVLGAFYGIEMDGFAAMANGVDARHPLTAEQLSSIEDTRPRSGKGKPLYVDSDVVTDKKTVREGFVLGVDAHARATLVFSGRMHPVELDIRGGKISGEVAWAPLEVRHPWLGTTARSDVSNVYEYALSPIRLWAGSPKIDVTVRCANARLWASGQEGWTESHDESGFLARRTMDSRDASELTFLIVAAPGTTVINGGPLAGAGGRLNPGGFRARLGYEAALPWWLIGSASVETDFKSTTTIVPLAEIATPELIVVIPSLGLGAGVPIQFRTGAGTRAGVRMQLTASFPVISVVFPVDVFPGAAPGDVWQVAIFGQASF